MRFRRFAALALSLGLAGCSTFTSMRGSPGFAVSSARFCDQSEVQDARQQDRLLRFAAVVRGELEASGADVALISRTGIDLKNLGIRFSHTGIGLKQGGDVPWSVRQLYYACDEGRPRLFDQGVAGFLFNTDEPTIGHVSIVLPPPEAATRLEQTALDKPRALRLLAARYSANAYPFSTRYQNCNQWVMELLATAWGDLPDGGDLRERAQAWLAANRYDPAPVDIDSHLVKLGATFMPLVHLDDHPDEDRYGLRFKVSLPQSIEGFVQERLPASRRIEVCHDERQVVIRSGWRPIADGCLPEPGDRIVSLVS